MQFSGINITNRAERFRGVRAHLCGDHARSEVQGVALALGHPVLVESHQFLDALQQLLLLDGLASRQTIR